MAATIRAIPSLQDPEYSALVTLAKTLARQMDDAGGDPSTRLSAAYLSVQKDVLRVKAAEASRPSRDTGKRAKLAALRNEAQRFRDTA